MAEVPTVDSLTRADASPPWYYPRRPIQHQKGIRFSPCTLGTIGAVTAIISRDAKAKPLDATELAEVFDAVGDPTRVKLMRFVLDEEHCVTQCTEHIGLTQSAVSKHLAKLTDAGLLTRRREGRRAYYRAARPAAVVQIFADAGLLRDGRPTD